MRHPQRGRDRPHRGVAGSSKSPVHRLSRAPFPSPSASVSLGSQGPMSTAAPKSTVEAEIAELEERLRLAELGPDPKFFEEMPDDNVVLEDGQRFGFPSLIS